MNEAVALSQQVGARIRELRQAHGLSLSEVARRAGLGKATLSELEAGRRNPTLETLFGITTALGQPLSAVIPAGAAGEDGAATPVAPMVSGAAVDARLLERFADGDVITEIYRMRIRAGARQLSPAHMPGVREYVTVFAGVAQVGDPSDPLTVSPGEHVSWEASQPHVYAAPEGDVEAMLVMRYPGSA